MNGTTKDALPKLPGHDGPGVQVHLLDGGSFSTATLSFLHHGAPPELFRLYDWCFLIFHRPSGRYVLWDLGCSHDESLYTPWVKKIMLPSARPVGPRKPVATQLEELGVKADQIDSVLFSHAHWDHCRPISDEFPNAKALFGPGTKEFCSPGNLENGEPDVDIEWDGRWFGSPKHVTETWSEFDGDWVPFGVFDRAIDFFGDGSLWVIDAPGHMPGNLCAAVRLEGSQEWVLLGSDCCHSQALLREKEDIALYDLPTGETAAYLHKDLPAARITIDKIRLAESKYGMHIALAHDATWLVSQHDPVLMSLVDDDKRGIWLDRVAQGERP
ncbi:beta-lactamase-like protein [Fusarium solani]|uniref:Beta-lactamase-like protein n=1 Tax=Fusarium solani TaxID=169388 RepID=A0A9P9GQJ2_FUSSL|nr:beta-lactamase-like protein [Fusarium solani]KAH7242855.1 beta-lactamase-like protein [Fusarium solani]